MRNSILFLFLIFQVLGYSQSQSSDLLQLWPDTALAKANSALEVSYMNYEEKQVVYYINLCRMNPALFGETFLKEYTKENKIKKDKDVRDLISQLKETSPRVLLKPDPLLTQTARNHAQDMGNSGRTGHNASDGSSYQVRMENLGSEFSSVNENTNYGNELALNIVIDLIIGRNVPNAGHRRNILDIESRFIGVAIEPHKRFRFNCVQDFGGSKNNH